jgi:hypothetical protein
LEIMKKLFGVLASSVVVLSGWLLAVPVSATTCTTVLTSRGILTAAVVGQPAPGTTVDASGCDIGVYVTTAGSATIAGVTIHDANKYGLFDDGAILIVKSGHITNTGNHSGGAFAPNGVQTGIGILFAEGSQGTIDSNTVASYQKGGISVDGCNPGKRPGCVGTLPTSVTVTNNTVTGLGPVDFIAQNGIQVSRGAVGDVRGNTISDNFYTGEAGVGPNAGGQNPEGFEYVSVGLLLFEAGAGTATSDNHFSGNQINFATVR